MVDVPSGHNGSIGDLGWALTWTLIAVLASWGIAVARSRTARPHSRTPRADRATGRRLPGRLARRPPQPRAMGVLFVLVPVVFILAAEAVTPDKPIAITLDGQSRAVTQIFEMPQVHAATMAPIAVASLAALVGLFVMLDSTIGDRRAALAGLSPATLLTARLGVLALTVLAATAVALGVTALVFQPTQWATYAGANILIALAYGLIGALLAPTFGPGRRRVHRIPPPLPRPRHRPKPHAAPHLDGPVHPPYPATADHGPCSTPRSPKASTQPDHSCSAWPGSPPSPSPPPSPTDTPSDPSTSHHHHHAA